MHERGTLTNIRSENESDIALAEAMTAAWEASELCMLLHDASAALLEIPDPTL